MLRTKLCHTLVEYCIIYVLTSLFMDKLLVRVVGAPNNLFIAAIGLLSGFSVAATVLGVILVTDENDESMR